MILDFYGVRISLHGTPAVLEPLRRDFEHFLAGPALLGGMTLSLSAEPPPRGLLPRGMPLWRLRDYSVHASGSARRILYDDGSLAIYDYGRREGRIFSAAPARLHELAYLAVLSRAGEELDRRGLHRAHALGFESRGHGGLILMRSGQGKSTLALELVRRTGMGIVGEETPLLSSDGRLLAFPLRWAFRPEADLGAVGGQYIRPFQRKHYGPKRLVDVAFFRSRIRSNVPLRWLIVGERRPDGPRFAPISKARAFAALAEGMVLGSGVAQMAEYMLRIDAVLPRILMKRSRAALSVLGQARLLRFFAGPDAARNAAALESL